MLTLDQLIDAAKERKGIASDRRFSVALGLNGTAVNQYRTMRALPSDQVIIDLCEMADLDARAYLIELAKWRAAHKGEAGTWAYWNDISEKLSRVAMVLFFALAGVGVSGNGQTVNASTSKAECSYIMRHYRRRRRPLKYCFPNITCQYRYRFANIFGC